MIIMKMKQVIVVRGDIGMSPGKLAAQCCHASVSAVLASKKTKVSGWTAEGQTKIVLQAPNEDSLLELKQKCDKARIVSFIISDAGHTELPPGTVTCIGIGPDAEGKIDKITGSLKLLK